jgi:hypothetical protein
VAAENCQASGETFHQGQSCIEVTCEGACCHAGGCIEVEQAECASSYQGTWIGAGAACSPDICEGACCNPATGYCSVLSPSSCTGFGGEFQGFGTDCDPNPCVGACCLPDGTCSDGETQTTCEAQDGLYMGDGTDCASLECLGACCLPGGACQVSNEADCTGFGGTWTGPGTTCPDTCDPCEGELPDGDINGDAFVNALDVQAFVAAVSGTATPEQICAGDCDDSGDLGVGDIPDLVDALLTGP